MSNSAKSTELQIRLKDLDSALVPGSSKGIAQPLVKKVIEGTDRVFGES
jgi:hypothetical protein